MQIVSLLMGLADLNGKHIHGLQSLKETSVNYVLEAPSYVSSTFLDVYKYLVTS